MMTMSNPPGAATAGKPLRRSRIFDYLAITGFVINMIVVVLIVGHWLMSSMS